MTRILGGDANGPQIVLTPKYGPDAISRRTAVANAARTNPAGPRSWGIGVRPAPLGSVTEGTKTDAFLPPQQNFRGIVRAIIDPKDKTIKTVSQFPAANVQVNPVLLAWSQTQLQGRGF